MNRLTRYALGLLVEEMGEALQMIGKALRFGLDAPGPDRAPYFGKTARQLLPIELGDVGAAKRYAIRAGVIPGGIIEAQTANKLERLLDPASVDSRGSRLAPDTLDPRRHHHWIAIYVLDDRVVRVPEVWARRFRVAELEDSRRSTPCDDCWDARLAEFDAFEKAIAAGMTVEDY